MSLTAGARIGPYEIVSAIGAGGMGEVFRARELFITPDLRNVLFSYSRLLSSLYVVEGIK